MSGLPVTLPSIAEAKLPELYEAAKAALAACARVDECQQWADKMAALASYARQSEDEALFNHARRIQARAVDRCGELLRAIPSASGARTDVEPREGDHPRLTREAAASDAGLSPHRAKTALRVNAVPRHVFEDLVESDSPPTITALAELGTKRQPAAPVIDHLRGRDPDDFHQAGLLVGLLKDIVRRSEPLDLAAADRGLSEQERQAALSAIEVCAAWLCEVRKCLTA